MDSRVAIAGRVLLDQSRPLKERFRALFSLKNLGGKEAIDWMSKAFDDPSALLKHEVAYCLGQVQDPEAIEILEKVLLDESKEPIVRHEAGEALGAIGRSESLPLLNKFVDAPVQAVADTCKLAVARIEWLRSAEGQKELPKLSKNPYHSVDPAPPSLDQDTRSLESVLVDESLALFERYRAMFALRNKGDDESVNALTRGFKSCNSLLRHEVAYVLGQIQSRTATQALLEVLRDESEVDMVRHEAAEALGSIAPEGLEEEMKKYLAPSVPAVLRESCVIALDFSDYNKSGGFQYANTLTNAAD